MKKLINEQFKRMQLLAGLITESQLNELDANVEKLRDAFLAKLDAVSKAYQELHNDDLFSVDKGAFDLYKKFFDEKSKTNKPWEELRSYVKGSTPPKLGGSSSKPAMPPLPPKPGATPQRAITPPPLPPKRLPPSI